MKSVTTLLLALFFVVLQPGLAQAKDYKEGKEYQLLSSPQPTSTGDKIEVLEVFMYGCPHCFHLEPLIDRWLANKPENVEFFATDANAVPASPAAAAGRPAEKTRAATEVDEGVT